MFPCRGGQAAPFAGTFASHAVAVETATVHLMDWLITDFGFTPTDAYCLVSTCPDFRINVYQMCKIARLSYVAGAEIPKQYLLT